MPNILLLILSLLSIKFNYAQDGDPNKLKDQSQIENQSEILDVFSDTDLENLLNNRSQKFVYLTPEFKTSITQLCSALGQSNCSEALLALNSSNLSVATNDQITKVITECCVVIEKIMI